MLERKIGPLLAEPILPEELRILPLECQEGVREVLTRRQQMGISWGFYEVRDFGQLDSLIPFLQLQENTHRFFEALRPFKIKGKSWDDALAGAKVAAWRTAQDVSRGAAFEVAKNLVLTVDREIRLDPNLSGSWEAVWNAADCAAWETIKNQPGFEQNPFFRLLTLHELGVAGTMFHRGALMVDLKVRFLNGREYLACLRFSNRGQGEQKVNYIHSQSENCLNRKQLFAWSLSKPR